jgi:NTE family protein
MKAAHGLEFGAPHPDYAITAFVLQGGGALGSYQAGVYEGMVEAGLQPNWIAGISIGALNAAIIAGNPPQQRIDQLRAFWESICRQPSGVPTLPFHAHHGGRMSNGMRKWIGSVGASRALLEGQNGFFVPRPWYALAFTRHAPGMASYYDTRPLRSTLERFADFDRINDTREMRVSVGAVNVRNGNFTYFDNTERKLRPEHFMASGALPPGFPAVEVDGEFYWDGGLVSNTPLEYVLATKPRRDALIFQVDLWSAIGPVPADLLEVAVRQKDIQYSSRTRAITDLLKSEHSYRRLLHQLMAQVPPSAHGSASYLRAQEMARIARCNVIHLIYRDKLYESYHKDYQFGRPTMHEHWATGLDDMRNTLQQPDWLEKPDEDEPFVTHDLHRAPTESAAPQRDRYPESVKT